MDNEIKMESDNKDQQPDSPKQVSKKTRKDGTIKKRTKTGCKTCRHRRVKCDESKPNCRNCVKSRRPCTWHDPNQTAIEQQNPFPAATQFSHYQQGVNFTLPALGHSPMQYRHSLSALGGSPAYGPDLQQNAFATGNHYYDHSPDVEWPNYMSTGGTGDMNSWLVGQQTWLHPQSVGPLPYYRGLHASSNPELNIAAYSAYPGMPPDSNNANWQSDSVTGSASAASPQGGSSATHADTRKSSLRADNSDIYHATSSQLSPPLVRPSLLSRATSYQGPTPSHSLFPLSEDTDSTDDSWDESSEDFSGEDSALINLHSTQALAIDERKAYLLRHFVNNIRPCLSMSEPPLAFDGSSTWGEIIPCLALSCPGLLHGLMAASALHLAVLHGTDEGVPTKHFMVASKRLHRLLETPGSRHQLQTLSLCLLLAWYEVMNGDHARWIMHLGGASSFLLEHIRVTSVPLGMLTKNDSEVDEDLVQQITGFNVNYASRPPRNSALPSFETEDILTAKREWRARLDLFWWYIKMDVFHSFLSGDRLLLPYKYWNMCPPRGRIGLKHKVHASVDHLWLVLGRLAEFGGKDRLRKQRQVVASGGQWTPPPGFLQPEGRKGSVVSGSSKGRAHASNAPSANEGRARSPESSKQPSSSKKGPPMNFYGMMPPPTIPPSMLSSFHVNDAELRKHSRPDKKLLRESSVAELKIETERAFKEHSAIEEAFEAWRNALGSEFEPLSDDSPDTECPFRPILRYDDPLVACMWSLYYLGRILLRRYHPYSPPAMMVSAGVNARFTQEDAENIGRINGGLLQSQVELAKAGSINPTLVAALQEMTFPIMFAGVQYQSAQQRSWVMDNLLEFAKAAGWKSAYAVASALETAWTTQAENGRGPPYEKILSHARSRDGWVHARKPVASSRNMYDTPESEHESRFVSHDRGLITTYADARAYWAIGVLSSTDDMQKMFSQIKITDE